MRKENKGITLIALAITVAVLIILASVATYSGVGIIRQSKLNKFTTEMKIMQTEVNDLYQKATAGETVEVNGSSYTGFEIYNIGKELDSQSDSVFTNESSGIIDKSGYKLYDQDTIKGLGIDGIEQEYFVNVEKRSIVSHDGFEYEGVIYYTLDQLPSGLYNVEYDDKNTERPTFDVTVEENGNNGWKVKISNIQYNGYINKWQVKYQKEGQRYWSTSEDLEFTLTDPGNYSIRLANGNITSDSQQFLIEKKEVTVADVIEQTMTENTTVEDNYGNTLEVPAGFKVVLPDDNIKIEEYNVEKGIVIEDVNANGEGSTTAGSQFVWIPTGTIKTSGGEKTIDLNRYTFASDGTETAQGDNNIYENNGDSCKELESSTYGNTPARDITDFLGKAGPDGTGGFYIGRYEARKNGNKVIVDKSHTVYSGLIQPQAASLSQEMYKNNDNFTSDLVNSYAWDTALVFIQKCTIYTDYSQRHSLNKNGPSSTGTNNLDTQDVACNIYDMASNYVEWSTETANNSGFPCVHRGGRYDNNFMASTRFDMAVNYPYDYFSFRPILYL